VISGVIAIHTAGHSRSTRIGHLHISSWLLNDIVLGLPACPSCPVTASPATGGRRPCPCLPPPAPSARNATWPQTEKANPGTLKSPPYVSMPRRHPTFKNHPDDSAVWYRGIELPPENEGENRGFGGKNRKVKKSSGEKFGTFFAVGVVPLGVDGYENFFPKIFWDLDDGGHNEGVRAGSCHSSGETQIRNDGKFPPPKAKCKTHDKVAAYEGVSGRTLGTAMAPGESSAWSRAFRCTRGGHCLVPPRSQNRRLFLTRD